MIATYTCPECRRLLRTVEPLAGGTRVQCPQCRTEFATPEDAPEPPPSRAANVPPVPRAAPKLVDEGWQHAGAAPRDPARPQTYPPYGQRKRPNYNTSRKLTLAFVIICISLAVLILIIVMAQRKSQSQRAPIAHEPAQPRLQGKWEIADVDGNQQPFRKHVEFREDGTGRLWNERPFHSQNFNYSIVQNVEVEIQDVNLQGAEQFVAIYRIEWLHQNSVRLVDIQLGTTFQLQR